MKRLITIFMVLALLLSGMSGSLPETVYAQDDNISAVTETEEETSTDVSETDVTDDENTENVEDTENTEETDSAENTEDTETGEENAESNISAFSYDEEIEAYNNDYKDDTVAVLMNADGSYTEYASLSGAIYSVPTTGIETTIKIVSNISLTSTVWISSNRNVILTSDSEYTIVCSGLSESSYFDVSSGAFLTVDGDLTITASDNEARALVSVYEAEFNLKGGKLLANNAEFSRGIVTINKDSIFTMSGGTICGNPEKQSIGVYIQDWTANGGTKTVTFNMNGGTIKDCHSSSYGGAVYVTNDKEIYVNLTAGSIENCSANRGGAIFMCKGNLMIGSDMSISDCCASDKGGAVYLNSGANLTMAGGTISECYASNQGGAIAVNQSTSFIMNGGLIEKCYTTYSHGGGVYVNLASFTMNGGIISKCQTASTNNGGGIYVSDSTFTMENGTISECISGDRGGAVFLLGTSKMIMNNGTISKNSTSWNGGGIFMDTTSELVMNGGTITDCTAYQGGGVYAEDTAIFTMNNGAITNCKVTENGTKGGGIYLNGKEVTFIMNGGTISGNECEYLGGGIYTESDATIKAGQIINNKSLCETGYGGGIYVDKEATLYIYNVVIKENTATSLGGGIWACRTGDVTIYTTDGGAIYDNTATGLTSGSYSDNGAGDDIAVYIQGGWLGALLGDGYLNLSYHMLGGGANRYYTDGGVKSFVASAHEHSHNEGIGLGAPDGSARYDEANAVLCTDTEIKTAVALKNVVSDTAKENAEKEKQVIISGNSASRGAGIGTNGNLIIGTPDDEDDNTGNLTVEKIVTGTHGDTDKEFNFTVTLGDTSISGEYGEMTFKDGVATFTLKHGESKTATGLPAGVKYMVEEIEANQDDYVTASTNETGTIPENNMIEVLFINTKEEIPDTPEEPETPSTPDKPNVPDTPDTDETPDTGDKTNIILWEILLALSGGMLAVITRKRRKRKYSDTD